LAADERGDELFRAWERRRQGTKDISELRRTHNGRRTRTTSEITNTDDVDDAIKRKAQ
jgi:hypothetical protein